YGRAGERLGASWGRQRTAPVGQPLRIRSRIVQMVTLGEDIAQVTAEISGEVIQGQADSLRVAVPAGVSINEVSGPLVGEWQLQADALLISLLEPADHAVSVTIAGEVRLPREGDVAIPLLRLAGAERETGGLAVEVLGSGEITQQSLRGLDAADPTDLG